jgi:hypothetical protein
LTQILGCQPCEFQVVEGTGGTLSLEIDALDAGALSLSMLLADYVSRGVPVKLKASASTDRWVRELEPLLRRRKYPGPTAASEQLVATAAALPPLVSVEGLLPGGPRTVYGALLAGYKQGSHVDGSCRPSWALGMSGAKLWTFQYDSREDGSGAVDVETAAFEEDDIFDLYSSRRQYKTTLLPGELLLYAVWLAPGGKVILTRPCIVYIEKT